MKSVISGRLLRHQRVGGSADEAAAVALRTLQKHGNALDGPLCLTFRRRWRTLSPGDHDACALLQMPAAARQTLARR